MRSISNAEVLSVLMVISFHPQPQGVVYIESWKTGTRQVKEETLSINLKASRPEFATLVKDRSGTARYKLSVTPGHAGQGKTDIIEWMVELVDITQQDGVSLLKPSNDPEQDYFNASDRLGWLYPLDDPRSGGGGGDVVPLLAKRVVKIEGFFCAIQVTDYTFVPGKKEVLESMSIKIQLTNRNPTLIK